jgi:hypothetical protein
MLSSYLISGAFYGRNKLHFKVECFSLPITSGSVLFFVKSGALPANIRLGLDVTEVSKQYLNTIRINDPKRNGQLAKNVNQSQG